MGQINTGLRSVLSYPWVYDVFQKIMGARRARQHFSTNFIRAYSGCRLLDLGCGTARILEHLPENIAYRGYDINPVYIAAARARFGKRGHFACRLFEESEIVKIPQFDIVIAVGLMHHLNDDDARNIVRLARLALRPGGRFVSLDPVLEAGQHPIARFIIGRDRGQNVRDGKGYLAIALHEFNKIEAVAQHRAWIPYTYWIMECTRQ